MLEFSKDFEELLEKANKLRRKINLILNPGGLRH